MRRKYKIFIIIIISVFFTYFIYNFFQDRKLNIVSIGDGISSGETSYNIDGISYNDYIKEYFSSIKNLRDYDNTFSKKKYDIYSLIRDYKNNSPSVRNKKKFKQIIHTADIITIGIGEEELTKKNITGDLTLEYIKEYIKMYREFIREIREITDAKIMILSYYKNIYLSDYYVLILNSELSNICLEFDLNFIDVSDLLENDEYYLNKNSYYFNYKAHKVIANMIINSL